MQILGHPSSRNASPPRASPALLHDPRMGTGQSNAIKRLPLSGRALPCRALHESQVDALVIGPCSRAVARAANGTVRCSCMKDMRAFGWTVQTEPRNRSRDEMGELGRPFPLLESYANSGVQTQPGTNTVFCQRDLEGRGWGSRHLTPRSVCMSRASVTTDHKVHSQPETIGFRLFFVFVLLLISSK